ncbi:ubiquinol-cytochrome C chaperone family protein [uncultured Sphingomonas sp.]|uniref:ubiquinol-cytochrome C chaperone family protein n=1 Tax=uncultured Sphingomonas sp. TaxID=158754 RepID=UPI0035CAC23B
MSLLQRLFGRTDPEPTADLYNAIVVRAREPHWYVEGAVPDSVDGRFDVVAAVLALVMLRLEQDGPVGAEPSARLAERFVDDMDSQLRQLGIGDMTVGKHIGRMMSMLGGRLGAYREGLAGGGLEEGGLDGAIMRNLFRGEAPAPDALAHVRGALTGLRDRLAATTVERILEGWVP